MLKNETDILGGKAIIYTNDYDVWQFRCWVAGEKQYIRKSLRTKHKEEAIEDAENLYYDLMVQVKGGQKLFGTSVAEAIDIFLQHKRKEVGNTIVAGRFETIKTHLRHFTSYVGEKTKTTTLTPKTLVSWIVNDEETNYATYRKDNGISSQTILNELSTINTCFQYLNDEGHITLRRFQQPPVTKFKYDTNNELVRRQTFTDDEWKEFYTAARSFTAKKNKVSDEEMLYRQLTRHYFLFAASSGMRSGELRQLNWQEVSYREVEMDGGKKLLLAAINVLKHTTKVRQERFFISGGGDYLKRWSELSKRKSGLVFSIDGEHQIHNSTINRYFNKILKLTDIEKQRQSQLVPYSLRHFCVTQMVLKNGLSYQQVAQALGTSVGQVERTYLHLNEQAMLETAMARYVNVDNKKTAIWTVISS